MINKVKSVLKIAYYRAFRSRDLGSVELPSIINNNKRFTVDGGKIRLLPIGDSHTRNGLYLRTVQDSDISITTVGTRTYDEGVLNVEGRGGWKLSDYFNRYGSTKTVDSPFLFPSGVPANKYWGNVVAWKNICYVDPDNYEFNGFQKIAKGWTGEDFLFDFNGYPKRPTTGDVVLDPEKEKRFLRYDGNTWVTMDEQPGMEFSFSKYVERYLKPYGIDVPNAISILLGTNDYMKQIFNEENGTRFIHQLNQMLSSIREFDPNMTVFLNLPMLGNTQDKWRKYIMSSELFNANMKQLSNRLIAEYRHDDNICLVPFYAVVSPTDMTDIVHLTDEGYRKIGALLAKTIQEVVGKEAVKL